MVGFQVAIRPVFPRLIGPLRQRIEQVIGLDGVGLDRSCSRQK